MLSVSPDSQPPVVERRQTWCPRPEDRAAIDPEPPPLPQLGGDEVLARLRGVLAELERPEDSDRPGQARTLLFDLICDYDLARSSSR